MSGISSLGIICTGMLAALALITAMGIIAQCVIYLCLKICEHKENNITKGALQEQLKERYKNDIYF